MIHSGNILFVVMIVLAGVLLYDGWRLFWFLTDDAYIAFRYISNSQLGYGYVWNPPPFLPVEGYTSFLWIVILDGVWRILGIEPPDSANWIALAFCYGTLLVAVRMILRLRWHDPQKQYRLFFTYFLMAFLIFNRTFLAWSSSGLETSMLNFFLILWVHVSISLQSPVSRSVTSALSATALALTRPDGLLFCAATFVCIIFATQKCSDRKIARKALLYGILPFLIVIAHLLWRIKFYGEWLPNTYYAKVTGAWPQSGWRYFLSFVIEYSLWFPLIFICCAFIRCVMINRSSLRCKTVQENPLLRFRKIVEFSNPSSIIVIGTIVLHWGYYTLLIGGDHFEYRVYSHLIPMIFVAFTWSLTQLRMTIKKSVSFTLLFVLLSMPIQWTHWVLTKDFSTRLETWRMYEPVAPHFPGVIRPYVSLFDDLQSWLIEHMVCIRHQEHKAFWRYQLAIWPSRKNGMEIPHDGYPVLAHGSVGIPAWVLPHVSIIDTLGLNDYVIARTPGTRTSDRYMGHSPQLPEGYVESYQPNVTFVNTRLLVFERENLLTWSKINKNENHWRQVVKSFHR